MAKETALLDRILGGGKTVGKAGGRFLGGVSGVITPLLLLDLALDLGTGKGAFSHLGEILGFETEAERAEDERKTAAAEQDFAFRVRELAEKRRAGEGRKSVSEERLGTPGERAGILDILAQASAFGPLEDLLQNPGVADSPLLQRLIGGPGEASEETLDLVSDAGGAVSDNEGDPILQGLQTEEQVSLNEMIQRARFPAVENAMQAFGGRVA